MPGFAIELSDRALAFARGGEVLSSEPSAVFDGSTEFAAGSRAWDALRRFPAATSTQHFGTIVSQGQISPRAVMLFSSELARRLAEHAPQQGEPVWLVAPAHVNVDGLGAAIGILREQLKLSVDGVVDAATVSIAGLGLGRDALVLELGLHHVAVTAVDGDRQARRRRTLVSSRGGLMELYTGWLDLVSTAMVKQTRFDPLHDAATEQQVFANLPSLAREAAQSGSALAVVNAGADRLEVPLSRDQFAEAAQAIYREIVRLLHDLRRAGASVVILVPQLVLELPGLRNELDQFIGCDLIALPDGFGAAAASLLELPGSAEQDSVRYVRRLPVRGSEILISRVQREALGQARMEGPAASHVLLEGRAYALGGESIVVGRLPPGTAHAIALPDGLAGVSRRHCTFVREGGELFLVDHSTFGTFVNGERVSERVRVHAGDRVRIGEPGVELSLIAVGESPVGGVARTT